MALATESQLYSDKPELTYPCANCGTLRTKAEGGTTFTVCDSCWDKAHPKKIMNMEQEFEAWWDENDDPDGPYITHSQVARAAFIAGCEAQKRVDVEIVRTNYYENLNMHTDSFIAGYEQAEDDIAAAIERSERSGKEGV
jgi:hypothetical protein